MHIDNNTLEYLKDTQFLKYVFEGTPSQLAYWRGYVARRPDAKMYILKAKYVLLYLDEMDSVFTREEVESLKKQIAQSLKSEINAHKTLNYDYAVK